MTKPTKPTKHRAQTIVWRGGASPAPAVFARISYHGRTDTVPITTCISG